MGKIRQERAGTTPEGDWAERARAADLGDAAARWKSADAISASPLTEASNVVAFRRSTASGSSAAPAIPAAAGAPAVPPLADRGRGLQLAALLILSGAAHAALYFPLHSEPAPMASIGTESIIVEIVLGADQEAGLVRDRGAAEVAAAAATELLQAEPPPAPQPMQAPQPTEAPPPQHVAESKASEPSPAHASLEAIPFPPSRERANNPQTPEPPEEAKEAKQSRQPSARDARNVSSSAPAAAAGGIGRGRSDADSNYRGQVAAHLTRHKRFPAEARSRGDQGSVTISFALDGRGRVAAVNVVRGSGVASLDREATAMVRRASPFPAPPHNRGMSFTVPVSFKLR